MRWVTRVGNSRRSCTESSSSSRSVPALSGCHRILAAATASCTARLTPTPPIGDIACAASPMQRSPGRCQRSSRSTATVKSLTCSQSLSSSTRSANTGMIRAMLCRNAGSPARLVSSIAPLRIRKAHCQYSPRSIRIGDASGREAAHGFAGVARFLRQPKPEHIHRRADILDLEARRARARWNGGRRNRR